MRKISYMFGRMKQGFVSFAKNPSFTLKEQMGYASGCFGNTMGQDMVGTFITLFLTDYMGIDAKMVLTLMVVAKIVNIIGDPVAGAVLDNGKGRVKPFLLISPFPLAVTSVLLFVVPAFSMTIRIVWVFVFYLIFCLSDTFYDMSMLTMSVRMTNNQKDRKNFYTIAQFASSFGTTLPGGVIPIFVSLYSANYAAQAKVYLIAAILFGVLGLATMLVPYFTLNEKNLNVTIKKPTVKLNFKALIHNRPLLLLSTSQIVDSIRQICYGALAYFYLKTLNAFWLSTVIGAISVVLSYVGIALVPVIGRKLSARDMLVGSYFYTGICYILLLVIGYKSLFLVAALISIAGFPNGMMGTARKILLADSTDYMEWKTWKKFGTPVRSDGMVFALNSMSSRISGLWKDLLLPAGLALIGYASATVAVDGSTIEATQTPETIHNIFYLVTIPGILGNLIPGIIMLFDNFTGKRRENILKELAEMRQAKLDELALASAVSDTTIETGETAEGVTDDYFEE